MQAAGSDGGGAHAAATYRGLRTQRRITTLGEINVTPLVDVVLVLLLVFMVTAPMMSRGIDVSLPVANQPQT
jgi:biopolymer transport protein ExbD